MSINDYLNNTESEIHTSQIILTKNSMEATKKVSEFGVNKLLAAEKLKGILKHAQTRAKSGAIKQLETYAIKTRYQKKVKQFESLVSLHIPQILLN